MAAAPQDLVAEVGVALQRYQRSVQAFDDAVGRALALNPTDLRCLDWLTEGPLTAGQLAEATGLRPAATTAMIDRLAARGLVQRVPSRDDRRRVMVEMTEEGRTRTWRYYGPMAEQGTRFLGGEAPERLAWLRDLLVTITEVTDQGRARVESDR